MKELQTKSAEILCVGTELLLGDVVNTNASDVAKELASLGINVYHHEVVGDNVNRLKESLDSAFSRCDIVVLTGGLGPTYDDLTKETAAAYFGKKLVMDEEYLVVMEGFFKRMGRPMTDNNRKQAMMPEGCIVLPNPNGTAPGCVIEGNGKAAILMPGPPREMRPMLYGPVKEYLMGKSDSILVSKVLNLFGVGESAAEDRLKKMMVDFTNPTVAPYAKTGEMQLRITARAATPEEGHRLIEPVAKSIKAQFTTEEVYGEDFAELSQAAVSVLTENGHKLATAESCTGGLLSSRLIDNAGASQMLVGGVVAYSNELKQSLLGVTQQTLESFGAVSEECALEMARGIRKATGSDIGISTTGLAGPKGGTVEKPIGLVYVAYSTAKGEGVRRLTLARGRSDDRENIRQMAVCHGLYMAIQASRELK